MKKYYLITIIFIASISNIFAQAPQGMNYQAIVRDGAGNIIANTHVSFRITITNGNGGSTLYQETQADTTNQFGLVTLNIGSGTPVSGTFIGINWAAVSAWMQVELDPAGGSSYISMGTSQLLSVPYALLSGTSLDSKWAANGTHIYKTNTGHVGIGTTTPDSAKLVIAGPSGEEGIDLSRADQYANFRVMRNSRSIIDKDMYIGYLSGAASSLHFYSNNIETMTVKGGNVGIGNAAPVNGKLQVTPGAGQNGISVDDPVDGYLFYGTKSGFNEAIWVSKTYAGSGTATIHAETAGYGPAIEGIGGTGISGTSPSGYGVYGTTTSGSGVYGTGDGGYGVYGATTTGTAGYFTSSGAGNGLVVASGKAGIGTSAPTARFHVADANPDTTVFINSTGGGIGILLTTTGGSGIVATSTGAQGTAIYGECDNGTNAWGVAGYSTAGRGGYFSTGTGDAGYFNGNIAGTGTFSFTSDMKLKKDIQPMTGALDKIMQLKPSTYQYRVGEFGTMTLSKGNHFGVIAQDLQKVFPDLVSKESYPGMKDPKTGEVIGSVDYLGVNYNELIPVLIKGIQEQQATINDLKAQVQTLKSQLTK